MNDRHPGESQGPGFFLSHQGLLGFAALYSTYAVHQVRYVIPAQAGIQSLRFSSARTPPSPASRGLRRGRPIHITGWKPVPHKASCPPSFRLRRPGGARATCPYGQTRTLFGPPGKQWNWVLVRLDSGVRQNDVLKVWVVRKRCGPGIAQRRPARILKFLGGGQGNPFFETAPNFGCRPNSLSGFGSKSSK